MFLDSRKKMLEKVKAILAKTMDNGCTEEEAMTALAKARELMATYEIDEKELNAFDQEKATIFKTAAQDPYEIKSGLCQSIARFTSCVGYGGKVNPITFCGLESDVIFATWLLETLQRFVMRALREYQKNRINKGMGSNNFTSASFIVGCVARIKEKLKELTPVNQTINALTVAELERNGIKLVKYSSKRNLHEKAAMAGHKAGNSARFDKPVGQGGVLRLK